MKERTITITFLFIFLAGFFSVCAAAPEGRYMENRSFSEKKHIEKGSLFGLKVTAISEEGIISLNDQPYFISKKTKCYDENHRLTSMKNLHPGDIVDIEYMNAEDLEEISYKRGKILLKLVVQSSLQE